MADLSTYAAQQITDWITGVDDPDLVGTRYVALYNGDPQGAGTEVTDTIRVAGRVAITSVMSAADGAGASANGTLISFGEAAGAATVSHFAIFDGADSGNLLASDVVTGGPLAVEIGETVQFPIGALTVTSA